eukprot:CCRYP_009819-RA/>CCRYP_009819-RA protein AED:0.07 eAED:0.05 QI:0/0/0/1/1/1/2/0/872
MMLRIRVQVQRVLATRASSVNTPWPCGSHIPLIVARDESTRGTWSSGPRSLVTTVHSFIDRKNPVHDPDGTNLFTTRPMHFAPSCMLRAGRFSTHALPEFDESDSEAWNLSHHRDGRVPLKSPTSQKKKHKPTKDDAIPKQSTQAARILFQSIAPHVEFRTLHQLTKQLTKMISRGLHPQLDSLGKVGKKRTLKRRLGMLFERDDDLTKTTQYSWSVKSHLWMEPIVYNFLVGKFLDSPSFTNNKATTSSNSLSYQADSTYPPNRNRHKFQRNLKTLIKAREMSLKHPIFWTEGSMRDSGFFSTSGKEKKPDRLRKEYLNRHQTLHAEKSKSQLVTEGESILELLMHKLPQPHFEKLMALLEKFADVDGNSPGKKRESWFIDDDMDSKPRVENTTKQIPIKDISRKDSKQQIISVLGTVLNKISASHSHLVAVELGKFFYVDMLTRSAEGRGDKPSLELACNTDDKKEPFSVDSISTDLDRIRAIDASFAIRKHHKLNSSDKRYQKTRDDFVTKMLQLQHDFASWKDNDTSETDSGDAADDSSDDVSSDLMVKEFQKEQLHYTIGARKQQQEALAETLVELRKMGLRKEGDGKRSRGRPRKGTHLKFTAVKMEDDSSRPSEELFADEFDKEQRIVFINNLPIDTTEEEIEHIYSRCGPLDSVKLFNLRPDLDPGPLSKKQLEERRRKQRLSNTGADTYTTYQKQTQNRPRTPVYGILTFQTAEGFGLATSPEMSLFGCVIRRHPVMSIKPRDMKTLYLENIPPNLLSIEVEYKLARLLHPHKMYVMLDGMKGVGRGGQESNGSTDDYQEYSEPASCEIKFENFRAANDTYQWMNGDGSIGEGAPFMGSEDCQIHWFRTPIDGMRYWTRDFNF